MSHAVSGMAATIRNATESETFDLAGQIPATIEKQIRDAFLEPLPLTEMIRLTFITGAGKLERQKYDENAAKAVTATLRELGFQEDRGASAVLECAGTFKLQHDTGKNLKTVVVFPRVTGGGAAVGQLNGANTNGGQHNGAQSSSSSSLLPPDSPEHKLAHASMTVFKQMVETKCPSWSQKRACLAALESIQQMVQSLEQKLMTGTLLSEPEQNLYDSVSMTSITEKQDSVRDMMHHQVDNGAITAEERRQLLDQVGERLTTLAKEIEEAQSQGKTKRVENLSTAEKKAMERKEKIMKTNTQPPHPLSKEGEIIKIRKELVPLLQIEEAAKGRLMTIKESQTVAKKDELLREIERLEQSSRGWFETDESFASRVERSRSTWQASQKSKKTTAASTTKATTGRAAAPTAAQPASKWVTTSNQHRQVAPAAKPKKNKPNGGGNLFAAMMADSDSD